MSALASFFKESHTSMGAFYPLHYLVVVMDDLDAAKQAERSLLNSGVGADAVKAVPGQDYLQLNRDEEDAGVITTLAKTLSRGIATEQISNDHNEHFAHQGRAFLFVHCPTEQEKSHAWDMLAKDKVLAAHYYHRFALEHLACDFDTT
jgi:hypothetical protein